MQEKSRASPSPANRNLPKATESSHNASCRPWGWKAKEICQETGERQRERFKSSTFIQHIYEYSWGTGRQVHLPPIKQIHSYTEQDLWHSWNVFQDHVCSFKVGLVEAKEETTEEKEKTPRIWFEHFLGVRVSQPIKRININTKIIINRERFFQRLYSYN